ncbi:hypothetical protein MUK42_29911 [Musa troglodytarum]|uniref:Uncharacterized protein n=1 Tax=Musa troglodytarum TaxID=320322 RepID=A0A9E7FHI5_9LILI|nr:hypothetical protein MUK42_29911 [Musa troglodytarum]
MMPNVTHNAVSNSSDASPDCIEGGFYFGSNTQYSGEFPRRDDQPDCQSFTNTKSPTLNSCDRLPKSAHFFILLAAFSKTSQYFTIFFIISLIASSVEQYRGAAMKVAYFENQSTTASIDPSPPTTGKLDMKSREMLSHDLPGTGNGSKSPTDFYCSTLSC